MAVAVVVIGGVNTITVVPPSTAAAVVGNVTLKPIRVTIITPNRRRRLLLLTT